MGADVRPVRGSHRRQSVAGPGQLLTQTPA